MHSSQCPGRGQLLITPAVEPGCFAAAHARQTRDRPAARRGEERKVRASRCRCCNKATLPNCRRAAPAAAFRDRPWLKNRSVSKCRCCCSSSSNSRLAPLCANSAFILAEKTRRPLIALTPALPGSRHVRLLQQTAPSTSVSTLQLLLATPVLIE